MGVVVEMELMTPGRCSPGRCGCCRYVVAKHPPSRGKSASLSPSQDGGGSGEMWRRRRRLRLRATPRSSVQGDVAGQRQQRPSEWLLRDGPWCAFADDAGKQREARRARGDQAAKGGGSVLVAASIVGIGGEGIGC